MHARLFAPLLPNCVKPASKFPQVRLLPGKHSLLTRHRRLCIPFSALDAASVDFAKRELTAGQIVELRREEDQLTALGFFEPQLRRVDVFELTPSVVSTLPVISEDFFMARLHAAWESRQRILRQTCTNAYRIVNGHVDGLPSLFVDLFSDSFVRLIATSAGAERLVPAATEFLRRRGAEEVLLDTPSLGSAERLTLITPTIAMPQVYVEGAVRFRCLDRRTRLPTLSNVYLLNTAHRRARLMLRDLSRGRRVLCVNDRSGGATMNAVMTANHVTVAEAQPEVMDWVRANLEVDHSEAVFDMCDTLLTPATALDLPTQQDVVYLEHHPATLATPRQWSALLTHLMQHRIIGPDTVVIAAQETAPLGVPDLLSRWRKQQSRRTSTSSVAEGEEQGENDGTARDEAGDELPATRSELAHVFRATATACGLHARFLRVFAASCDYPLLPEDDAQCFTHVFLMCKPCGSEC